MTIKYWVVKTPEEYRVIESMDTPSYMEFEYYEGFETLEEAKQHAIELINDDIAALQLQRHRVRDFNLNKELSV